MAPFFISTSSIYEFKSAYNDSAIVVEEFFDRQFDHLQPLFAAGFEFLVYSFSARHNHNSVDLFEVQQLADDHQVVDSWRVVRSSDNCYRLRLHNYNYGINGSAFE